MPQFTITRIEGHGAPERNIPGRVLTVTSDKDVPVLTSLEDFFTWLRNNPDFLAMLLAALMAILGATPPSTPPRKAA